MFCYESITTFTTLSKYVSESQALEPELRKNRLLETGGIALNCVGESNQAVMSCVFVSGTPRSEVQEEVECAPSPHLSLTLKVRRPQPGKNIYLV